MRDFCNGGGVVIVSALFVQGDGCYSNDSRIDPWPVERNALSYDGYGPVICHPPCQLWGKLARVNFKRWGGEHNRPGNDGGCFEFALNTVNALGGVLEHPAGSYAFEEYGIEKPSGIGWKRSGHGWVCEVWQSAYGHKARKATWLYYSGLQKPFDLSWSRAPGTHQVGFYDKRGKEKNKPTLSKREANATPHEFKEVLIALAIHSKYKAP